MLFLTFVHVHVVEDDVSGHGSLASSLRSLCSCKCHKLFVQNEGDNGLDGFDFKSKLEVS